MRGRSVAPTMLPQRQMDMTARAITWPSFQRLIASVRVSQSAGNSANPATMVGGAAPVGRRTFCPFSIIRSITVPTGRT